MRRSFTGRFVPALVGATALVATACGGGGAAAPGPGEQLAAAFTTLSSEDVAWSLAIDASSGALAGAQDVAAVGAVAPFLTSFAISGSRVGDDASFTVKLMGANVLTLRSINDGDALFARLDVQGLLDLAQIDAQALVAELGVQGLPESLLATLSAALGGDWIGLDVDLAALAESYGGSAGDRQQMQSTVDTLTALVADPSALIERIGTVTTSEDESGAIIYDVAINVPALGDFLRADVLPALAENDAAAAPDLAEMQAGLDAALTGAPATVAGLRVTTVAGRVTEVAIDLGQIAAAFGEPLAEGEHARLVFTFDREGLAALEQPEVAVTLTEDDLSGLFGLLSMGQPEA